MVDHPPIETLIQKMVKASYHKPGSNTRGLDLDEVTAIIIRHDDDLQRREISVVDLPCPFCGGHDLRSGGDDKFVGVWCEQCGCQGPNHYGTGNDWNKRATREPVSGYPTIMDALSKLVILKDHKDKHGKDAYYEFEQPIAWRMAKEALDAAGVKYVD